MPESDVTTTSRCNEHPSRIETPRVARSSTSKPPQRFYSTRESHGEANNKSHEESIAARYQAQVAVNQTRAQTLHTLTLCRTVITTLEVTRMAKSRVGFAFWRAFWERIYSRDYARFLICHVQNTLSKVDFLFRNIARELHEITLNTVVQVVQATTEEKILRALEQMEQQVGIRRRRRRKKARSMIDKMRANIEAVRVTISDEIIDGLKRVVFALDPYCDYYPGDTEEEMRQLSNSEQMARWRHAERNFPGLYRHWHSAASGAIRTVGMYYLDQSRHRRYSFIRRPMTHDELRQWRG
ncbi:hypothetical protein ASPWEDRAFT_685698 [Aspergillus wentii DTO 134E9]|uniref:Uncharacterized protein n=1 Tax=Aspergillus wentii DTO 134E9 TaxID=1073089 RepID=A0A1L9R8I8_ASPWE|nr:uncharacterized protein ASPWEDRAFT_685698 [Aspergillus wentii DTO 134E9]KAI9925018.1 hypothetical protein MW887_006425 [Aspergillus wentii]OJJ31187.1 hypothetical protein ASPWEDRAFT_685698 [Aspergillus wentii DTO 134E9]